jgi:hypothetical protein
VIQRQRRRGGQRHQDPGRHSARQDPGPEGNRHRVAFARVQRNGGGLRGPAFRAGFGRSNGSAPRSFLVAVTLPKRARRPPAAISPRPARATARRPC